MIVPQLTLQINEKIFTAKCFSLQMGKAFESFAQSQAEQVWEAIKRRIEKISGFSMEDEKALWIIECGMQHNYAKVHYDTRNFKWLCTSTGWDDKLLTDAQKAEWLNNVQVNAYQEYKNWLTQGQPTE